MSQQDLLKGKAFPVGHVGKLRRAHTPCAGTSFTSDREGWYFSQLNMGTYSWVHGLERADHTALTPKTLEYVAFAGSGESRPLDQVGD